MSDAEQRSASIERKTKETEINVQLVIDGSGEYEISTGIAFFDHMLESFARHGVFDLRLLLQFMLSFIRSFKNKAPHLAFSQYSPFRIFSLLLHIGVVLL